MGSEYVSLKVSKKVMVLLDNEVKEEFLKHHPEMQPVRISRNFLLMHALSYYVSSKHSLLDALLDKGK